MHDPNYERTHRLITKGYPLDILPTEEELERVDQMDPCECPRRYCWHWNWINHAWDKSLAEGCGANRTGTNIHGRPIHPFHTTPCKRLDPSNPKDHFEPNEPAMLEDGIPEGRWDCGDKKQSRVPSFDSKSEGGQSAAAYHRNMPDTHTPTIHAFIDRYLAQPSARQFNPNDFLVDTFGDSPEMADRLLALVLAGTKTATCSSLWAWEHEHAAPLTPGTHAVILDGANTPRCIIETTQAPIVPYNQVTADFARAEGEHTPLDLPDEQVLEHWRQGHWAYFSRTLPPLGLTPSQGMPVICERFRVIYAEQ